MASANTPSDKFIEAAASDKQLTKTIGIIRKEIEDLNAKIEKAKLRRLEMVREDRDRRDIEEIDAQIKKWEDVRHSLVILFNNSMDVQSQLAEKREPEKRRHEENSRGANSTTLGSSFPAGLLFVGTCFNSRWIIFCLPITSSTAKKHDLFCEQLVMFTMGFVFLGLGSGSSVVDHLKAKKGS